jgi:curli production assembly/transport component CsgE
MNPMKCIILALPIILACDNATAQTAVDSTGIYIKQSSGENADLPENRTEFNERPVLNQNNIRSISLYYTDQDEWVTISSREDLQWGTSELIGDSESGFNGSVNGDSIAVDGNTRANRLAELLGEMISGRGSEAGSEETDTSLEADDETMTAFREAFEAVMQEENETEREAEEDNTVELPVMYGNVNGIVLDETRSKTGRDFYNAFYDAWSKSKGVENSVVRVAEKPGPGMGSIVYVEVNYEEIFELRLRPGDQRTKQAGAIAAARTLGYLKENSNKSLTY